MKIFKLNINDKEVSLIVCETLKVYISEKTIVMLKGKTILNKIPVTAEEIARAVSSEGVDKVIEKLDGVFSIAIYHGNAIFLGRSIHSGPGLYYCVNDTEIYVSNTISDIKSWKTNLSCTLNIKMAERYLSGRQTVTNDTLITNVYKVNNGEYICFDCKTEPFIYKDEFTVTRKSQSTVDAIISNIEMLQERREKALLFSGGLDSALIFHSLKEADNSFSAYHFVSDDSKDSEKEFARQYCVKYGVKFIEVNKSLDFNEQLYYGLNPSEPDEVPLVFERSDELDIQQGLKSDELLFLSGHGGDHIFGQNPSVFFGIDALRDRGLRFMHKKMVEYANLKGRKYKDLLFSNISELKQVRSMRSLAKHSHISDMRLAAAQLFCSDNAGRVNIYTPFLHKNIVQHYADIPVYELFNQQFDRHPVRSEAFQRFGSDIFMKKTKRSSSQLIFRILSQKQDEIKNAIAQSHVTEILDINDIELNKILYENTTVRLTLELPYILNLYRLAKFMQLQHIE